MLGSANFDPFNFLNVTSVNVVRFLTNLMHIIIQNHTNIWNSGSEFSNNGIYIYNFIQHCPVILHACITRHMSCAA